MDRYEMTLGQLKSIMPHAKGRATTFLTWLNAAMFEFGINTSKRAAAFIAQLAHESGELRYMRELASGEAYEGREDLGNTEVGDGVKFKGRGPIQITGKNNYRDCSLALFGDERLLDHPELLEQPEHGCRAAGWFWKTRKLNHLADNGKFVAITKRINGGTNGLADREAYYKRALVVMGA